MPPDDDEPDSLTDLAGLLIGGKEADTEGDSSPEEERQSAARTNGQGEPDTSDEETGADELVETPSEDDQTEDSGEEPSTEPFYTVKIDGKDERVTLKEALSGYQRQIDYTRKTEEVAAARRAVEAEVANARAARDQYAQVLQLIQEQLGHANQEPTAEQWNALRAADPNRYSAEYADYQRREDQRRTVREEQARIADQRRGETLHTARNFIDGEREKLVKVLPVFADQEKGPAEMKALRDYAIKSFGFSDAEIDQAYDHRMILMLNKARQWDNHQTALKKAKGKIEGATQIPAPGARQPVNVSKSAARKAAMDKFTKSGDIDDAVALLIN